MAKFYGKNSGYLSKNEAKYYIFAIGLALLPILLIGLVLKFFSGWPVAAAAIVLILVLTQIGEPVIGFLRRKSGQFYRGARGEKEVKKILQGLPDNFSVFEDVRIGHSRGNIDFVAVGPAGIFVIEVKSFKGKVGFNGQSLTINGRDFKDGNVIRQVHGEMWAVKSFLEARVGRDLFVRSVLVFSSLYASMPFGFSPVANIYTIQKDFLPQLFAGFADYNYPVPRQAIETALAKN